MTLLSPDAVKAGRKRPALYVFPVQLCAPEGTRTPNLLIRSQMLYPLSYGRSCWASLHNRLSRGDSGIRTREGL